MRRYLPLFYISVFVVMLAFCFSFLLSSYADKQNPENKKSIVVYTTLSIEHISVLAEEYEKIGHIKVQIIPLTEQDLLLKLQAEAALPQADVILSDSSTLDQLAKKNLLMSYSSEQVDVIPEIYKSKTDQWVGIWYDPIVFAFNLDYFKNKPVPANWDDLTKDPTLRIGITDFLAAKASANLFYTLIAERGEEDAFKLLRSMHKQVVRYANYLSTPVRMAGMGECDIAIAVQSEVIHYIHNGFPIKLVYPKQGTPFMLTGAGLVNNPPHSPDAQQFIDWLLQNNAHVLLQNNRLFFIPTNPEARWFKEYTPDVPLWVTTKTFSEVKKQQLLDDWVQTIRFGTKPN